MREETKQEILAGKTLGEQYDEAGKNFFMNKEIIAPILKCTVEEYKDCDLFEIEQCIDRDSISEEIAVGDIPVKIEGMGTEMTSITEKLIRYDIHFKAAIPGNQKSKKDNFVLHFDFEVQNEYHPSNPSYPIIKRAIYYGSREISSQLGRLTETTNYDNLSKVYSIWVCNNGVPAKLQNTVTRYRFLKEDIIGITDEPENDYDLINVVIIRRGGDSDVGIFDYLNGIFTSNLEKIEKYISNVTEPIRKGVETMTGLSAAIAQKAEEKGYKGGFSDGKNQAIYRLVQKGKLSLEEGAEELGVSTEEFRNHMLVCGFSCPEA